jgi:hypothetical protein
LVIGVDVKISIKILVKVIDASKKVVDVQVPATVAKAQVQE